MPDSGEYHRLVYHGRILIVDDEASLREWLSIYMKRQGHTAETVAGGQEALDLLRSEEFDLVLTDLKMPGISGLEVLRGVRARWPATQVVVMTAFATPETAIAAMKEGAYDYLTKPFKIDEIGLVVSRGLEKRALIRDNTLLRQRLVGQYRFENLIGKSQAMQGVFDLSRRVASTKSNVLITGESGTGKELVARALHTASDRASGPLVAINCGAIPESLLEAELFGHVRGAFTGAVSDADGVFLAAHGGTLVLDEIGELPLSLQPKLLRALQERRIRPVGASRDRAVDVRLVAITNRDLQEEVAEGRFRQDLFYRLNVIQIEIPPLRDRRADIPLLVHHFVRRVALEQNKLIEGIAPEAMQALLHYAFPGNVRELENLVERGVALAPGPILTPEELAPPASSSPSPTSPLSTSGLGTAPESPLVPPEGLLLDDVLAAVERRYLESALSRANGVRKDAARLLGITLRSLRYRLDKLGID